MRKKLITLILFTSSWLVNAQQNDVSSIVTAVAKPYENMTFSAKFSAKISTNNTQGTIYVSGDRFKIETDQFTLIFDGENRYNYIKKNNEVYIESQSSDETQIMHSPQRLFQLTKNSNPDLVKNNDGTRSLIFNKEGLIVRIDNTNNILDVDDYQNKTKITLLSSDTRVELPDSMFIFNENDYSDAEIIDFR